MPYVLGDAVEACINWKDDLDYYEFVAPDTDLAGGYVQFHIKPFAELVTTATFYTDGANASIASFYQGDGELGMVHELYLAVAPGHTYRVAVGKFYNAEIGPTRYQLTSSYSPIPDAFEPNDTRETAVPIRVGEPITAFLSSGFVESDIANSEFDDWYELALDEGNVEIALTHVPSDLRSQMTLFSADGDEVLDISGDDGVNLRLGGAVAAGRYALVVTKFGVEAAAAAGKNRIPADHLRFPYTLSVEQ